MCHSLLRLWLLPSALGCARGWENPHSQGNSQELRHSRALNRGNCYFSLPQPCRMSGCPGCLCSTERTGNIILASSAVPGKSPQSLLLALIFATPNTRLKEPASILWWICLFSVTDTHKKKKLPKREILNTNTQCVQTNIPESSQKAALLNGGNSKLVFHWYS